jgi:predicted phage terminase large subunit-like protein
MILQPQPGAQEDFLSTEADICIYGGAAGGGKSFALLLEGLRNIDNPNFNAMIFRRNNTMIRNQGSLWDESMSMYMTIGGHPRQHMLDWTFKSGSSIKFGHLEHETTVYNYQGSQICYLAFDELTHFTQSQFFYMLSRNRSVCGVKPYIRATTNPDKISWVRNMIDWWIGNDGYPIPERSGVLRWFVRDKGEILWADTAEELQHIAEPKSFTFIPAKLSDNQILMQKDPSYLSSLMAQNTVERAKLLDGNWDIDYSDYGVVLTRHDFSRYSLSEKMKIPGFFSESYFVLDGASRTSEANDYSVLGLWAKGKFDQQWYIIDWLRIRLQEPDLEQAIIDKWHYWRDVRYNNTIIFTPKGVNIERGACGIGMMQRLPRKAIPCFELEPIKDKFYRLNDGLGIIKSKWVNIPDDASWANTFFEECECFRADMKHVLMSGEIKPHDDQIDNMAYAISSQVNQKAAIEVYKKPQQQKPRHGLWLNN